VPGSVPEQPSVVSSWALRSKLRHRLLLEVAPLGNRPLLMLLEHDRGDEPQDGSSVREDAHHIRAPADLLVQALLQGLVLQIWRQSSFAEVPEGQQVLAGLLEVVSSLGQLPSQRVNHSLELSLHLGGVRLVEDGAHQGCHARAACDPATLATRSRELVGTTPLLGDPG